MEQLAIATELYEQGYSLRAVARQIGLTETTLRKRLHQAGVRMRAPGGVALRAENCVICGRPLKGHPRCPVCGLLVGPGHEVREMCADCRRRILRCQGGATGRHSLPHRRGT